MTQCFHDPFSHTIYLILKEIN
ncbi:hypothetical protein EMIT0196P_50406 [Pseudomonas chlororaphis]